MIVCGDARSLPLADSTVQCVVTSPPYWGLRDYGVAGQLGLESSPDAYVANLVAVFREVRRLRCEDILASARKSIRPQVEADRAING